MPTETLDRGLILSDREQMITDVHHPWRIIRERLPEWEILQRPLPPGMLGGTDTRNRTITIDSRQLQAQKRCTIDHELLHAEDGDTGCQHPHRERAIEQASARRLVSLARLLEVIVWANGIEELADECWVDVATMRCRLEHLHPSERAAVNRALANRDNEETP